MPEGSVDLAKQICCWKAKIHVFVIIGAFLFMAVALIVTDIISYTGVKSDPNGYATAIMIMLMMPAFQFCCSGLFASIMLCCKSKCCFGYVAIVSVIGVAVNAYSAITALAAPGSNAFIGLAGPYFFVGSLFKIVVTMIGVLTLLAVVNQAYCTFILCKLSYFDRSGGGEDSDLYSIDVEKKDHSGSTSSSTKTLKHLTRD